MAKIGEEARKRAKKMDKAKAKKPKVRIIKKFPGIS